MKRWLIILCSLFSLSLYSQTDLSKSQNLINCRYFPDSPFDNAEFYTSRGLWYGFTIPEISDKTNYGKFGGPYCLRTQKWISKSLIEFDFGISGKGVIPLSDADSAIICQFPGMLYQKFFFDKIIVELKLNYISNRTCLYQASVVNLDNKDQSVSMRLKGSAFENIGVAEKFLDGWMFKIDGKDEIFWLIRFRTDNAMEMEYSETDYKFSYKELQIIRPGNTLKMVATISQYFIGDPKQDVQVASESLENPGKYEKNNQQYWEIINNLITIDSDELKKLSLKCVVTLFNNLRSPLPEQANYYFFRGQGKENSICDIDETWLVSSALIRFDTRLAMHQLASVLTSLNPDSSINRFLSFNHDYEISSPISQKPMAAWTCWNIFSVSKDLDFLVQAFPLIEAYHNYWYTNCDKNNNSWCENSKGIETVELNALLYTEKYCLEKMSKILGDSVKVIQYQKQINDLRDNFNKHFYNDYLKQYCDISLLDDTIIISNTAAGYCMWSGLASYPIASEYAKSIDKMFNSGYYDGLFSSGEYSIDYYYFLLSGLKLYGYNQLAELLKSSILSEVFSLDEEDSLNYYDKDKSGFIENSSMTSAIILLLLNY